MALTTQPLPADARDALAKIGLDQVFNSQLLAAESFVNSEKAFRATQRLQVIGFAGGNEEAADENKFNEEGIAHLGDALSNLVQARSQLDPGMIQRIDSTTQTDAFRGGLARARENFVHQLSKQDLHSDDFKEIVDIWDSKAGMLLRKASPVSLTNYRRRQREFKISEGNRIGVE